MKILILGLILTSMNSFGHGDHHIPGSIPAAPHGGVVKEAVHQHAGSAKHDHGKANKKEVFYEAVLKNNLLTIYVLELSTHGYQSFLTIKTSDVKIKSMEALNPRKKKSYKLAPNTSKSNYTVDFSKIKGRRFIITISALYAGANYVGKVQVERK